MYPDDRRYSKEHEWIAVEEGTGTLGITDYAQDQLGDIVYVELPETGRTVTRGDVLGTIESVKAVSEIYAPVGGTVLEGNASLEEAPEIVNREPHAAGWFCKLRIADPAEMEELMSAADYEEFVAAS